MSLIKADLIIKKCSQVLTCKEDSRDLVGLINNAWIAIDGEVIVAIGTKEEIENKVDYKYAKIIDGTGKVVAPGFVDCHTHLVFGGSRVKEYVARLTSDNLDILLEKGIKTGLDASIEMTNETQEDVLVIESLKKIR